ncbi:hypothetical protein ACP6H1_27195 [Vibrio harveyi]|uniref:hypothetical protein n=1 Tax=Vibrio harveyi TaxID=669 RepID=UPI003CF9C7FB
MAHVQPTKKTNPPIQQYRTAKERFDAQTLRNANARRVIEMRNELQSCGLDPVEDADIFTRSIFI